MTFTNCVTNKLPAKVWLVLSCCKQERLPTATPSSWNYALFAYNKKYCMKALYTQHWSIFSLHRMMLHKLTNFEFMQVFRVLLTASSPWLAKGVTPFCVHWRDVEIAPPISVTNTDMPVVAVLPLSDSRINNTTYQLRRVHSSTDGGEVCTILSVSLFCQTHSLAIHI